MRVFTDARLFAGLAVLCTLPLAACGDATAPAMIGPEATASVDFPSDLLPQTDPCGRSALTAQTGQGQFHYRAEVDHAGGLHMQLHVNEHQRGSVSGGGSYEITKESTHQVSLTRQPFPVVVTIVSTLSTITRGPAPNFREHVVYHLTINKNTQTDAIELTPEVVSIETSCGSLAQRP